MEQFISLMTLWDKYKSSKTSSFLKKTTLKQKVDLSISVACFEYTVILEPHDTLLAFFEFQPYMIYHGTLPR